MVNIYLNLLKASLASLLNFLFLVLILGYKSVLILPVNIIDKIIFNIKINKIAILMKPYIKH